MFCSHFEGQAFVSDVCIPTSSMSLKKVFLETKWAIMSEKMLWRFHFQLCFRVRVDVYAHRRAVMDGTSQTDESEWESIIPTLAEYVSQYAAEEKGWRVRFGPVRLDDLCSCPDRPWCACAFEGAVFDCVS